MVTEMLTFFTLIFWSLARVKLLDYLKADGQATPWTRVANFVKKPPVIVNVTYFKLNGFNASKWVY